MASQPKEARRLTEAGRGLRHPWRWPGSLEGHIGQRTLAKQVRFPHAKSLALGDLFLLDLATAPARRRRGSALGRRVHVSPS